MDSKKASALSAILTSLLILGGVQLTDDDVYFCEDRMIVMRCDSFSKYYGLPNGKCYNPDGNKVCRSGWIEIENDIELEDKVCVEPVEYDIVAYGNGKTWQCESNRPYAICKSKNGKYTTYFGELK